LRLPDSQATSMPKRLEPVGELAVVLLGEDLGGRHQHRLAAVLGRLQHGQRGDAGLAAAHVALQQALHRMGRGEVAAISEKARRWAPVSAKGSCSSNSRVSVSRCGRRRVLGPAGGVGAAQGNLLGQQFIQLDALPGRMTAVFDVEERHRRRRRVQHAQRVGSAGS
jgi:hypothetical protein